MNVGWTVAELRMVLAGKPDDAIVVGVIGAGQYDHPTFVSINESQLVGLKRSDGKIQAAVVLGQKHSSV